MFHDLLMFNVLWVSEVKRRSIHFWRTCFLEVQHTKKTPYLREHLRMRNLEHSRQFLRSFTLIWNIFSSGGSQPFDPVADRIGTEVKNFQQAQHWNKNRACEARRRTRDEHTQKNEINPWKWWRCCVVLWLLRNSAGEVPFSRSGLFVAISVCVCECFFIAIFFTDVRLLPLLQDQVWMEVERRHHRKQLQRGRRWVADA